MENQTAKELFDPEYYEMLVGRMLGINAVSLSQFADQSQAKLFICFVCKTVSKGGETELCESCEEMFCQPCINKEKKKKATCPKCQKIYSAVKTPRIMKNLLATLIHRCNFCSQSDTISHKCSKKFACISCQEGAFTSYEVLWTHLIEQCPKVETLCVKCSCRYPRNTPHDCITALLLECNSISESNQAAENAILCAQKQIEEGKLRYKKMLEEKAILEHESKGKIMLLRNRESDLCEIQINKEETERELNKQLGLLKNRIQFAESLNNFAPTLAKSLVPQEVVMVEAPQEQLHVRIQKTSANSRKHPETQFFEFPKIKDLNSLSPQIFQSVRLVGIQSNGEFFNFILSNGMRSKLPTGIFMKDHIFDPNRAQIIELYSQQQMKGQLLKGVKILDQTEAEILCLGLCNSNHCEVVRVELEADEVVFGVISFTDHAKPGHHYDIQLKIKKCSKL